MLKEHRRQPNLISRSAVATGAEVIFLEGDSEEADAMARSLDRVGLSSFRCANDEQFISALRSERHGRCPVVSYDTLGLQKKKEPTKFLWDLASETRLTKHAYASKILYSSAAGVLQRTVEPWHFFDDLLNKPKDPAKRAAQYANVVRDLARKYYLEQLQQVLSSLPGTREAVRPIATEHLWDPARHCLSMTANKVVTGALDALRRSLVGEQPLESFAEIIDLLKNSGEWLTVDHRQYSLAPWPQKLANLIDVVGLTDLELSQTLDISLDEASRIHTDGNWVAAQSQVGQRFLNLYDVLSSLFETSGHQPLVMSWLWNARSFFSGRPAPPWGGSHTGLHGYLVETSVAGLSECSTWLRDH